MVTVAQMQISVAGPAGMYVLEMCNDPDSTAMGVSIWELD